MKIYRDSMGQQSFILVQINLIQGELQYFELEINAEYKDIFYDKIIKNIKMLKNSKLNWTLQTIVHPILRLNKKCCSDQFGLKELFKKKH